MNNFFRLQISKKKSLKNEVVKKELKSGEFGIIKDLVSRKLEFWELCVIFRVVVDKDELKKKLEGFLRVDRQDAWIGSKLDFEIKWIFI